MFDVHYLVLRTTDVPKILFLYCMEFSLDQQVLNDLFGADITYRIPSYQRPYSWDSKGKSDKDNQVNVMWEDLIDHFESDNPNIYFMGSMVLIGNATARTFEVVDGQQRLTTLTLLFVAIKCMLQNLEEGEIEKKNKQVLKEFIRNAGERIDNLLFNRKIFGIIEQEKKVKIERFVGFDYDGVLKIAMECGSIAKVNLKEASEEAKEVVTRYFDNRNYLIACLQIHFLEEGILTYGKVTRLNQFIEFLKNKVKIVRILSLRFDMAYQIFEILNNRGLPLSDKDLFRNLIIRELYKANVANPEKKWLHLDAYEFTPEFISVYVESKNARKQRYSAFNDIQDIYHEYFEDGISKHKVEFFYKDIETNLAHYSNIELLSFDSIAIKHRVHFLKNAGNDKLITDLLLTLFRYTSKEDELLVFLKELELLVLYILLGSSKRFQSKIIFEAIAYLNEGKFEQAIQKIQLRKSEKSDLKKLLKNQDIKDNMWAKLILTRYLWAWEMGQPKDVVDVVLNYKEATLEHIIPQTPHDTTNWKTDFSTGFRKKYTYKLGNMTLLTQAMNAQAKNYDFAKKKEVYKKTKLDMTQKLAQLNKIDEMYIKNRHENITNYLIQHFEL